MKAQQAEMLRKVMEVDFVLHETVLYLDGHPDNQKAMDSYKKVSAEQDEIYKQYKEKYGPITADNVLQNYWSWIDFPWPWQNGKEAGD